MSEFPEDLDAETKLAMIDKRHVLRDEGDHHCWACGGVWPCWTRRLIHGIEL